MYAFMNVTRLASYLVLGYAALFEELPWWIVIGFVLYDNNFSTLVKLPFTDGPSVAMLKHQHEQYHNGGGNNSMEEILQRNFPNKTRVN